MAPNSAVDGIERDLLDPRLGLAQQVLAAAEE
jgi:hypothetical protein